MPEPTWEIVQISIILQNLPHKIYRVQRMDVIEDVGCCASICYEFISEGHCTHVDPAAWLLSSLVNLLTDKYAL